MNASLTLDAVAPLSQEGLSLSDILRDLPTDPGSIFALVLVVGFLILVLYFGIRSEARNPPAKDTNKEAGTL
ncbi:MAG: hypothetical protein WD960_09355 [Gemmatimonadota bacterium]